MFTPLKQSDKYDMLNIDILKLVTIFIHVAGEISSYSQSICLVKPTIYNVN